MKNVQVPHEYFRKALSEYSDWQYAWFREVIQNSVDAGSTQIDFIIDNSDKLIIEAIDNGSGMDKDTLENVFLTLGGSQKNHNSIGGFGYAKTIIAFAHNKYKIHTRNNLVTGSGGQYKIKETDYIQGTRIKVDMTQDTQSDTRYLYSCLKNRLELLCSNYYRAENITVTLNGKVMESPNKKLGGRRSIEGLGSLRYTRTEGTSAITWVTVKDLPMFQLRLNSSRPITGYIELEGNPLEVLTANRDGLRHQYSSQLYEVVNLLANDSGKLDIEPMIDITINSYDILDSEPKIKLRPEEDGYEQFIKDYRIGNPVVTIHQSANITDREKSILNKVVNKHADKWLASLGKNKWPDNFRFMTKEQDSAFARSKCGNKKLLRLAYIWKVAVCVVIQSIYKREEFAGVEVLSSDRELDWYDEGVCFQFMIAGKKINYGFIFDQNIEGLCSSNQDHTTIMINPLILDDDWYVGDILDLAIHEVTHCFVMSHDESWVLKNEQIRKYVRRSLDRERDILDWAKDLHKRVN